MCTRFLHVVLSLVNSVTSQISLLCVHISSFTLSIRIAESSIRGFWQHNYLVSTSTSEFMRNLQKVTIIVPKLKCKQQTVAARDAITAAADGQLAYS